MVVDLAGLPLHTDGHGLPIHGTMSAPPGWEVVATAPGGLATRFEFGAHPDLLASFPFPHELRIDVAVDASTLTMDTTVAPTSDRSVRWRSATTRTSASRPPGGPTPTSGSRGVATSSSTLGGCRPGGPRRGRRGRAARKPGLRRSLRAGR